jgi:hypothetical protein
MTPYGSRALDETDILDQAATSCVLLKRRGDDCERVFLVGAVVADGATSGPRSIVGEPAQ